MDTHYSCLMSINEEDNQVCVTKDILFGYWHKLFLGEGVEMDHSNMWI